MILAWLSVLFDGYFNSLFYTVSSKMDVTVDIACLESDSLSSNHNLLDIYVPNAIRHCISSHHFQPGRLCAMRALAITKTSPFLMIQLSAHHNPPKTQIPKPRAKPHTEGQYPSNPLSSAQLSPTPPPQNTADSQAPNSPTPSDPHLLPPIS